MFTLAIRILIVCLFISVFLLGLQCGLNKSEKAECLDWKKEAKKYPDYYITEWQKAQCDYHGVDIEAPVK